MNRVEKNLRAKLRDFAAVVVRFAAFIDYYDEEDALIGLVQSLIDLAGEEPTAMEFWEIVANRKGLPFGLEADFLTQDDDLVEFILSDANGQPTHRLIFDYDTNKTVSVEKLTC